MKNAAKETPGKEKERDREGGWAEKGIFSQSQQALLGALIEVCLPKYISEEPEKI